MTEHSGYVTDQNVEEHYQKFLKDHEEAGKKIWLPVSEVLAIFLVAAYGRGIIPNTPPAPAIQTPVAVTQTADLTPTYQQAVEAKLQQIREVGSCEMSDIHECIAKAAVTPPKHTAPQPAQNAAIWGP